MQLFFQKSSITDAWNGPKLIWWRFLFREFIGYREKEESIEAFDLKVFSFFSEREFKKSLP